MRTVTVTLSLTMRGRGFQGVFQETLSNQQRDFQQCGPTRQEVRLRWQKLVDKSGLCICSTCFLKRGYLLLHYCILQCVVQQYAKFAVHSTSNSITNH